MENLIYTTKEIGFEVSKNPTFFTVAPPPHPRTGCQSQVLTSTEAQMFHWAFSWGKNKETQPTFWVHTSPTLEISPDKQTRKTKHGDRVSKDHKVPPSPLHRTQLKRGEKKSGTGTGLPDSPEKKAGDQPMASACPSHTHPLQRPGQQPQEQPLNEAKSLTPGHCRAPGNASTRQAARGRPTTHPASQR